MRTPIHCTFFRDCRDRYGRAVAVSWSKLAARCICHEEGEKDGPALTCCTFQAGQPRGNRSVVTRTLVALDIEINKTTGEVPPAFASTRNNLTSRRVAAAIWTTHSHTPELPRYRVLMPLTYAIDYQPDIDPYLTAAAAAELGLYGVTDESKFGAASLFYLPRHPVGSSPVECKTAIIDGDPIDVGYLFTSAMTSAQGVAQLEAEVLARRRARQIPPELMTLIDEYNDSHPVAAQLARYGYRRNKERWKSRYQHVTSQGATTIFPDGSRWASFSESDADAGVGNRPARRSSQAACWGDSFALFVHYEHGGDFRASLASLKVDVAIRPATAVGPHRADEGGRDGLIGCWVDGS